MKSSTKKMFIKICQRRNISQLEADFCLFILYCVAHSQLLAYERVCVRCVRMARVIPIFRPLTTEFPHSYFIEFINANANCAHADRT